MQVSKYAIVQLCEHATIQIYKCDSVQVGKNKGMRSSLQIWKY